MKSYAYVKEFQCLIDKCEDTCCKGWGMQLDQVRRDLYEQEAPELLDSITESEVGSSEFIMKRDPITDYCVKFNSGFCSIHAERGADFLGDACYFYPKITRKFGDEIITSASLSCPEISRLILEGDTPFNIFDEEASRIPVKTKEYADSSDALDLINTFIEFAGDESQTPERIIVVIASVSYSLQNIEQSKWLEAARFFLKTADSRLLPPERNPMDYYSLVQTLAGIVYASKKTNPEFDNVFSSMEKALAISIDKNTLEIMQDIGRENAVNELYEIWGENKEVLAPLLRRWIQAQLSMTCHPFAGFGETFFDRAVTLSVRFATVKLAFLAHIKNTGSAPDKKDMKNIIYNLSRFMDHLADPELSMNLYTEAGWTRESRLRALIGDE